MALETVVTERDKKLIILLGFFLIVMGLIWFVIKPGFQDIMDLQEELTITQATADEMQRHIDLIPTREKEVEDLEQEIQRAAKDFYPLMESQEIDHLLTNMALNYGFQKSDLRELTIQNSDEYLLLAPYLATDETEPTTMTGMYGVDVNFTLYGTRDQIQPFLNLMVNEYEAIRVTDFVWTSDNMNENYYYLNMGLEIYMTDKEGS